MTTEELLDQWRAWIWAIARAATQAYGDLEASTADVAQEGNIELWRHYRRLENTPEPDRGRIAAAMARRRMFAVAKGGRAGRLTGHIPSQGSVTMTDKPILDQPVNEQQTLADVLMPALEDAYEEVLLAYHYGDVHKALADLRPDFREYVRLRFWEGLTNSEAARRLGLSTSTTDNRWKRTIQPGLRKALDHLKEAS